MSPLFSNFLSQLLDVQGDGIKGTNMKSDCWGSNTKPTTVGRGVILSAKQE